MKLYFLFLTLLFIACDNKKVKSSIINKSDNVYYDNAFIFLEKNNNDSAFINFYKAKDTFLKVNDSFGAGKCLVNIATILNKKGDDFG
ncbi:TPA: hypothetical protein ACRFJD_002330, partial [Elizabethkingia anophelis]